MDVSRRFLSFVFEGANIVMYLPRHSMETMGTINHVAASLMVIFLGIFSLRVRRVEVLRLKPGRKRLAVVCTACGACSIHPLPISVAIKMAKSI